MGGLTTLNSTASMSFNMNSTQVIDPSATQFNNKIKVGYKSRTRDSSPYIKTVKELYDSSTMSQLENNIIEQRM